MKTRNRQRQVCYNVQSDVETKNHLMLAHVITNVPDRGQLAPMTKMAQEALNKKNITIIADKGYFDGADIKATLETGAETLVPKTDTSGSEKNIQSFSI